MYPLLRMKDFSGIVVILLFFSATRCYIQESYTKSTSCSKDDEIYKNNSNIVFGNACPLEYDVPSKIDECTSKLNQQRVISDRKTLYDEARTSKIKEHSSKSSYYGSIKSSDVRKDTIRSTRDDIELSRARNYRDHRETKVSTERRILSRVQREADSTSEHSIRISTSRSSANRITNPRAIAGGNEGRSARFLSKNNLDVRSRNVVSLRSQSFDRDMQPSLSLRQSMVMKEHQEILYRFGNHRRQHENHQAIEKHDSSLTGRYSREHQTWKQAHITAESTMGISSSVNFDNTRINSRTSSLRSVKFGNKVRDARITDNFDTRSQSVTNSERQNLKRDTQPSRFLEIRMALDKDATSSRNQNSISMLREGMERDMQQTRRLEKRMVMDQREGRLHRFGNDRRQRENHRVFERKNNILTTRDFPTQTRRETDVTRGDLMGISTSRNFDTRKHNPNIPTLHTVRIENEGINSRLAPSRTTLIAKSKNSISKLRQGGERDMLQARRLEKRMVMDQREGRLHRFGNDRRQRENHRVFERKNNILTTRDFPTQTRRETDVTRGDLMGISTSRNFDTRKHNPNIPTLHTVRIENEGINSRLAPSRTTLIAKSKNSISKLRQGGERDMLQARRLEKRMVMDQREGRLHRFGNDRRQRENHRVFERKNNILTTRDFPTQTRRETDVTRGDLMGISTSRNFDTRKHNPNIPTLHTVRIENEGINSRLAPSRTTLIAKSKNSISKLRQGGERDMLQARRLEERLVINQRDGRLLRFSGDIQQSGNDRVHGRNMNLQNIREFTQIEREADTTLEDSVTASTSKSFAPRRNNPRTPTVHTIRIGDGRMTSRFIPSRINSRNQNLISTLRQNVERVMQRDRHLEKRMVMDQFEGRLHRFGNDQRQRENDSVLERNNNIKTIRDSPTQSRREIDVTREDPMGTSTSRSFTTTRNNQRFSRLRQNVERVMQRDRHLEKRMVMDQFEGRLHRFGNDQRQRENDRVVERNNNIRTIRDSPTQSRREIDVTREDPIGTCTSRSSTTTRINQRFSRLRQNVEGNLQQARYLEKLMIMDQRGGRQSENHRQFGAYNNIRSIRDSPTQTRRETDITRDDPMEISTSRSFTTRNNHRISTLRQNVERDMQQDRRLEKRMVTDQREGRVYQIDNDRRQLENNRKFRQSYNRLYVREERSEPSREKSLQRDARTRTPRFLRQSIRAVADHSSGIRSHGQSDNSNSHFFRDSVRRNQAGYSAATLITTNGSQRMVGSTVRNIRFNSHRGRRSGFSESKDYDENLPEVRQFIGLRSREADKTRRASLVHESSISSTIQDRQISGKLYRQNRDNYRSSRGRRIFLTDATDTIDTQKFRTKSEISEELVASRYSRARSSMNVKHTNPKDPMYSRSYEQSRNTILPNNRQRNLFENSHLSNDLKKHQVRLNEKQLSTRNSKHNRQSYLTDDIRGTARNFAQRRNLESSRNSVNSVYNIQTISRGISNINKNVSDYEQSSSGPWFGVIQISFAAVFLGHLIFTDEKNGNRIFSTNVLSEIKSS